MRLQRHSNGERFAVTPADLAGAGGEARVFVVPPDRQLAAKVYHRPTEEQYRKLCVMLANPPDDPAKQQAHISIAWPIDLVSLAHGERGFAGYLMPSVTAMRPLFQVYNPGVRRRGLRHVDTLFLHRCARNLAAAVRALHGRGYVIGDINESNILVGPNALVTLVDTDPFQVPDPGERATFRCPVGKPEYTPPELQGKRFTHIDRGPEHDRFGLAVLIFQLLMEGTHPFAGLYTSGGDPPPYEDRIAAGFFAYGNRRGPYRPIPIAPPFEMLDPALRQLFLRCFDDGHSRPAARPDAHTWQTALAQAERSLVTCGKNVLHRYGGHLSSCPWCERRTLLGGRDPFPTGDAADERSLRRVGAASLLPTQPSGGSAYPAPSPPTSSGRNGSPAANPGGNWQAAQPLTASLYGGAPNALPIPTLFSYRLSGSGWAWGALTWALLAIASAPLALPGLSWMTTLLSLGCGAMVWREGPKPMGFSRWVSVISALAACMSLALRPLTAAPLAGAAVFSSGPGSVRALCFTPDGSRLAAGTSRVEDASLTEGAVNIWDARAGRLLATPERASGDVVSVSYSPDGGSLIAATDSPFGTGEVVLVDASANGAYQSLWKQPRHIRQAAWSPDGSCLATASAERLVRLWDAKSLQSQRLLALPGEASALAFSPDGSHLAVGCGAGAGSVEPGFVSVWETGSGRCLWSKPAHGNGVEALAFEPHGRSLASAGNDGAVCLWEPATGRLLERQTAHSSGIAALAFAPDGSQFASAEIRQTESGTANEIVLRDPNTGAPLRTLSGSPDAITALAYDPKGGRLASGSRDGTIRLWRLAAK